MKTKKRIVLTAIVAGVLLVLAGCSSKPQIEPELTIDGHEVKLNETLKTATDTGLTAIGLRKTPLEKMMPFGAMEFQYTTIFITVPSDDGSNEFMETGVTAYVFNDTDTAAPVPYCKIGNLMYETINESGQERADKKILINGIDFKGMTAEDAFNAMNELGFNKKNDGDLESFIFSSGDYYWRFTAAEGDDGQLYITKVELELKIDKDFS